MIGKVLGILGGGQLGAMLLRHAVDFGIDVWVMEKQAGCPASKYTGKFVEGDAMDHDAVLQFGRKVHVLTIEKEAVNVEALYQLQKEGVLVYPQPETIQMIQNKFRQKQFLKENGFLTADGILVAGKHELTTYQGRLPFCYKMPTDGYDGKGVQLLRNEADLAQAFEGPGIIEPLLDIDYELSVMVARNTQGQVATYEPSLMVMDNQLHLLDFLVSPAQTENKHLDEACKIARQIADSMQHVGLLAIEFFVTKDGILLVNELSPRPHNSGHHTMEAAVTSQFEQHIRAILDLPLGDTRTTAHSATINILEMGYTEAEWNARLAALMALNDVHIHWYGKTNSSKGRKIGHITVTAGSQQAVLELAQQVKQILN